MLESKQELKKKKSVLVLLVSFGSLMSLCRVVLHVTMFVCMENSSYYGNTAF